MSSPASLWDPAVLFTQEAALGLTDQHAPLRLLAICSLMTPGREP